MKRYIVGTEMNLVPNLSGKSPLCSGIKDSLTPSLGSCRPQRIAYALVEQIRFDLFV